MPHPEEEDTPDKHGDDGDETNPVRDSPHIPKLLLVVWSLGLAKGCQKHHKHHCVKPVAPPLQHNTPSVHACTRALRWSLN